MRSIWKATVSFGLVSVPCKFYSATEDHDLKAHQVHAADGGKIRYKRICECCGNPVESRDIAKAYDTEEGVKVLTEDDLATLHEGDNREVAVLEFVPAGEINPLLLDKPYYLEPDGSAKAYTLLAKVLGSTDQVAIVRFTMRSKTHLAALRVVGKGDVLAIHTLRWADELREPEFPSLNNPVEVSDAELKVASQLVESMVASFNPDRYRDDYREELRELIASKGVEQIGDTVPDDVSDLVAKLTASVQATTPAPRKRGRKIADKPVRRRVKVAT